MQRFKNFVLDNARFFCQNYFLKNCKINFFSICIKHSRTHCIFLRRKSVTSPSPNAFTKFHSHLLDIKFSTYSIQVPIHISKTVDAWTPRGAFRETRFLSLTARLADEETDSKARGAQTSDRPRRLQCALLKLRTNKYRQQSQWGSVFSWRRRRSNVMYVRRYIICDVFQLTRK